MSTSVLLTLDVPKEYVKLTEYGVWADFMFAMQYTKESNPLEIDISPDGEITQLRLNQIIADLQQQRRPWSYRVPQAILEEIRPEWLVRYKKVEGRRKF